MASLDAKTGSLGRRLAAHLLRRSTYKLDKIRIDNFKLKSVNTAITQLLYPSNYVHEEPIYSFTGQYYINCGTMPASCSIPAEDVPNANRGRNFLVAWWLHEAKNDASIHHKMQFFLHTCFTADYRSGNYSHYFDHLSLLRHYALGNYREFAIKMSINNSMLYYLNGNTNIDTNPNENYAREFFELFTIGKGPQIGPDNYTNYTEADIVEAAKVFSGWKVSNRDDAAYIDADTNIPLARPYYAHHENNDKTFSSAFGGATITGAVDEDDMIREITDFVNMVFAQDETARYICRKMYRFFVGRIITDEIEQDIIEPLAAIFRDSDYDLALTISTLLKSKHFYDQDDTENQDETVGALVKSPIELVLQTLNLLDVDMPDVFADYHNLYYRFYWTGVINVMFATASFALFFPDSVAGYPPYYQGDSYHRGWFNSGTIITRFKIPEMLITGERILLSGTLGGVQLDMVAFVENNISQPANPYVVVEELLQLLFCENVDSDRMNYFVHVVFLQGLPEVDWAYEWIDYENTGIDMEVRIGLNNLIRGILTSPEYQLF